MVSTTLRTIAVLMTSLALTLASSGTVLADDISNDLDISIDATLEAMDLTVGGANGTAKLIVTTRNGDGKNGCNLTGSTALVVSVSSSNAGVATVSPSSITFTSCAATPTLTVTPVAVGSANVTLSQASNTTAGSFSLAPAAFTVNVALPPAPPNTPPTLNLPDPITVEATSGAGTAVTFSATAADFEDDPDPTPLCSPASGSVFAIGTTTLNCSVTDSNGATTDGSFTVTVQDTIEPTVEISTAATEAGSGWYNVASSGTGGIPVDVSASDAVGVTTLTCSDGPDPIGGLTTTGGSFTLPDGEHAISCAAQDAAGNIGDDAETFKVDQTGPTISPDVQPAPNAAGWNNSAVTVSYACDDATSGVASCPGADTIAADGTHTLDREVADTAGNSAWTRVIVNFDGTDPTIVGSRNPGANEDGWNNEVVTVHFACGDTGGSGIASCTDDVTVSTEGADQSAEGTAVDNAGNSSTATVSGISIDRTPPEISATRTPANGNGWNNGPVTVDFTCTDGLSGVKTLTEDVTVDSEVADHSVTGSCTDKAGNTSSTTVEHINVDLTAPEVTGIRTPEANSNGWNNGDVTVTFSCTDVGGSGVGDVSGPTTLSGEGAGQQVTGSCIDAAGNGSSDTVKDVNIDLTAPTIEGVASPAPNQAGWNNTPVSVSYICDDGLSGIESCGPDETLSADGIDRSSTGSAVDEAGNSASATVGGIDIDQVAPSVGFSGVAAGATYILGSVPAAGCVTEDELSGVKVEATLALSGGPVGQITATCSGAEDYAGNAGSKTIHYSVDYSWNGFFRPVDNTPTFNRVKAGSAVPVKFSLGGYQGMGIMAPVDSGGSFAGYYPTSKDTTCDVDAPTDSVETVVTAGGSSLTFDSTSDQYVYVWKTDKAWTGSCRQLIVKLIDGSYHRAYFRFTKP
jgi:hypothetical protein